MVEWLGLAIRDWLTLLFTGTIAISTIVYTVFTHRLWTATRISADIARYTTFMNYLMILGQAIEANRSKDPQAASLLESFQTLTAEVGFDRLLEDHAAEKEFLSYWDKVEGMLRAHNIDPTTVPFLRPILKRVNRNR